MDDTYTQLSEIIRLELGVDAVDLHPSTVLDDLPGWDSVALAGVLIEIEERFQVNAVRRDAGAIVTGADLARLCHPS